MGWDSGHFHAPIFFSAKACGVIKGTDRHRALCGASSARSGSGEVLLPACLSLDWVLMARDCVLHRAQQGSCAGHAHWSYHLEDLREAWRAREQQPSTLH